MAHEFEKGLMKMERKANAYAKILLVIAAVFIGLPLVVYVMFGITRGAWDLAGGVLSSSKESVSTIPQGSKISELLSQAGSSEAKRVEGATRSAFAAAVVIVVIIVAFMVITAIGLRAAFGKRPHRKNGKEKKHRRRRRVRIKV